MCDSVLAEGKEDKVAESDKFAGCAIVISHDRWFLDRIATHILAFAGDPKATFFDGTARAGLRGRDAGARVSRATSWPTTLVGGGKPPNDVAPATSPSTRSGANRNWATPPPGRTGSRTES